MPNVGHIEDDVYYKPEPDVYYQTRHSHRHSICQAQGLSHVTIKAKVILAHIYQKSYALSRGQKVLDDPKNTKMFCTLI